jgi:hypothetical protein
MYKVERAFRQPTVHDVEGELRQSLAALALGDKVGPGKRIAITAGSRGITDLVTVLRVIGESLRERGASPFIIPAMGSHGGATAEGQRDLLASLGIAEETTGLPVKSSMETVLIGTDDRGVPLYMDKHAHESDGVVVVNRIKPHTGFDGPVESGLLKMAVIGLGKHAGALAAHKAVLAFGYNHVIRSLGNLVYSTGKVLFGVGIVENAWHRTAHVEAMLPGDIDTREPQLLEKAKEYLPRLPLRQCDVLLVNYMGKEISGSGMDTNVLGRRWFIAEPEPEWPKLKRVILRDMTDHSDGNALGIGLADFVHRKIVGKVDWLKTYVNAVTSNTPEKARLPVVCENDREALEWALTTCFGFDWSDAKLCWIPDTLNLTRVVVSQKLLQEVLQEPGSRVVKEFELQFDQHGDLIPEF